MISKIDGVSIKEIVKHTKPIGFFAELAKEGEESFHEIKQTSYAETNPGVTKPFHLHKGYWELWCVVKGAAKVTLYDVRENSPTKDIREVFEVSENNMKLIAIPPGVAHTYTVLGNSVMGMLYHAGKAYDPKNPGIEEFPYEEKA